VRVPRYDFRCEAGHRFELALPFGSDMEQPCTRCDKPARRGFHSPLFRYRGMGFYTTDTRKNRRKPEKDPETSGRSKEAPAGDWPQQDETKHGDADASTAGVVRGSRPRSGGSSNGRSRNADGPKSAKGSKSAAPSKSSEGTRRRARGTGNAQRPPRGSAG
jgi:predicted nucleic acid-binding Zn ribbon protein